MRNPDRSVGEVADRADGVKGARDLHAVLLGIRRSGFGSPHTGDRASLLKGMSQKLERLVRLKEFS
jgi:hypothetical protein